MLYGVTRWVGELSEGLWQEEEDVEEESGQRMRGDKTN